MGRKLGVSLIEKGGEVIQFPTERAREWMETGDMPATALSCCDCVNVAMGTKGLFCTFFKEMLVHDSVAEDCPEYEL